MGKRVRIAHRKRHFESENGPSQCKVQRPLAISPLSTNITDLNDDCLMNQCGSENGPSQLKVQRSLAICPSFTRITDLNDNCSKEIFKHLNLRSLFNVAVANVYLRSAVGIVYKQKYGEHRVAVMNEGYFSRSGPILCGKQTNIKNLRTCLQYLRCLGSSISHLSIYYSGWNGSQCDHIHQYLNQYCAKTLASIRFVGASAGQPIKYMEKPFVNVRTVEVSESNLGGQLSSFSQWFPNMRSLTLDGALIDPRCTIDVPFPQLEELNIDLSSRELTTRTKKFTTRLLQQCAQLYSLNFRSHNGEKVDLKAMMEMVEGCRNIRSLKVSILRQNAPVILSDVQQLVDAHPLLVQLQLYGYKFSNDAVNSLILQLNSLKQFEFQIEDSLMYNQFVSQLDSQWQSSLDQVDFVGDVIKLER